MSASLRRIFDSSDEDGSGYLDKTEAVAAFVQFFPDESVVKILARIKEADTNSDGKLSFEEFAKIRSTFTSSVDEDAASGEHATHPNEQRDRLVAYLARYDATKLDEVDSLLDKFEGREDAMWAALTSQYGPEDASAPAPAPESTSGNVSRRLSNVSVEMSSTNRYACVTRLEEASRADGDGDGDPPQKRKRKEGSPFRRERSSSPKRNFFGVPT